MRTCDKTDVSQLHSWQHPFEAAGKLKNIPRRLDVSISLQEVENKTWYVSKRSMHTDDRLARGGGKEGVGRSPLRRPSISPSLTSPRLPTWTLVYKCAARVHVACLVYLRYSLLHQ